MSAHMKFPQPFEVQNAQGIFPAICFVEHARNFIPEAMSMLGLEADHLQRHIAWDIGIEAVTRALSRALDIPAIYCLYSRLIIDVNRPSDHHELCRPESDGVHIPGNQDLSIPEQTARFDGIYKPYHLAAEGLVSEALKRHARPVALGMHSCTDRLNNGAWRPWHIGMSTYESHELLERCALFLRQHDVTVGVHEPYDVRDLPGASLDVHGRQRGLPHLLIEIRQDLIADRAGAGKWAGLLEQMLANEMVMAG